MYTATTNLVASAQAKDDGVEGTPRTSHNFIAALQLSGFVGAALGTVLFAFAIPILRTIIGNDAIDPDIFSAALKYVRTRALGVPAAAIIGSSQAACLGMRKFCLTNQPTFGPPLPQFTHLLLCRGCQEPALCAPCCRRGELPRRC